MKLVIVESPTKAKTLSKFLGKEYEVVASMGHVRDLPKKGLGIDVDDGFKVTYEDTAKAKKTLADIRKKAETAEEVFLATDPDREGEAIAWHLYNAIFGIGGKGKKGKGKGKEKEKRVIPSNEGIQLAESGTDYELDSRLHGNDNRVKRVVFHEITKEAVVEAFENSRSLDLNLVDSQQARRVLDRLVGYKLSPLLWKKVRYGLSAGRVQSVAVRLIVDRELERQAFTAQEYWSVAGVFDRVEPYAGSNPMQGRTLFLAVLTEVGGKKVEISTVGEVEKLVSELKKVEDFEVTSVVESEKKRNTFPAFTTSTLTQAASNRFGFTAKRTMQTAQSLFEAGLITYHRTDSFFLSASFIQSSREYISKVFGDAYLPEKPNYYKSKAKNIQEAHEAIRPTGLHPEAGVTSDEQKLYGLIWARAVASQMLPAVFSVVSVTVEDGGRKFKFKASSSVLKFEGWLKVYGRKVGEGDGTGGTDVIPDKRSADPESRLDSDWIPHQVRDDNGEVRDDSNEAGMTGGNEGLARLKEKDGVELKEILPEQHFTQPPARYTEASLIKAMEEDGIGRPSTYAPTITTIQSRGYVTKDVKNFVPTDVAFVVTKMLKEHFPEIVDLGFTASMEENLDEIADGKEKWVPVIKKFYDPFISEVLAKDKELVKKDMTLLEETSEVCPKCGKNINIKLGKFGRFKSCSDFPTCEYAEPILVSITGGDGFTVDEAQLGKCPKCENGVLGLRDGKFGKFVGCGNYPKCDFRKSYMEKIDMKCPTCGKGDVVIKKGGRFKKIFYGCSLYPECKYIANKDPRNDRGGAEINSA